METLLTAWGHLGAAEALLPFGASRLPVKTEASQGDPGLVKTQHTGELETDQTIKTKHPLGAFLLQTSNRLLILKPSVPRGAQDNAFSQGPFTEDWEVEGEKEIQVL